MSLLKRAYALVPKSTISPNWRSWQQGPRIHANEHGFV